MLNVNNRKELALNRKIWNDLGEKSKNPRRVIKLMEGEEEVRRNVNKTATKTKPHCIQQNPRFHQKVRG